MILWTGQYRLSHPARIDITRAGCNALTRAGKPAPGAILAPSADLLAWGLGARQRAGKDPVALAAMWSRYEADYLREVRERIARDRMPLDALLALPEVVACCYCGPEYAKIGQCHRFPGARVLAAEGADYRGEMAVPEAPKTARQLDLFGGSR